MQISLTVCVCLQVAGNCMGIVGTVMSLLIFQNAISLGSVAGYTVTLAGIAIYIAEKYRQGKAAEAPPKHVSMA